MVEIFFPNIKSVASHFDPKTSYYFALKHRCFLFEFLFQLLVAAVDWNTEEQKSYKIKIKNNCFAIIKH